MVYKFDFYYNPTNSSRRIHLYLPNNYYQTDEKYPVIYFFDGNNLFYDGDSLFGMSMDLEWFLEAFDKRLIVVGIAQPRDEYERMKDHNPYSMDSRVCGHIDGRGDATIRWIIDCLKPHIDYHYRTIPFRETTAIAGASSAGLTVLYALAKYNNYFSKGVAISPAVIDSKYVLNYDIHNADISPDTKLFMSYGTEEYAPDYGLKDFIISNIYEVEKSFQKKGARTYIYTNYGGSHNEIFWKKEIFTWLYFIWKS